MHLLDIDVVHLVLVELIRGDVNSGQGHVENGQAIASWACDLVIKDVNLQVMHAELGGVLWREILQGLDKDGGAARGIDVAPFDVDDSAFFSVGGGLQPLSIDTVPAWLWEVGPQYLETARIYGRNWVVAGFTHMALLHHAVGVNADPDLVKEVEEYAGS